MKTFIIPTSQSEYLVKGTKKQGNFDIVFLEKNKESLRLFPDGEVYVRIPQIEKIGKSRVVVLHTGMPNANAGLIELEMVLQALKNVKAKVELFFSYFPYGMQDKAFKKGEINAAESLVKKFVEYYNVKKVYVIDPHFGNEKWLRKYPINIVSAIPILAKKAKEDLGSDVLFLSPDEGGKRRTGIKGGEKERIDSFQVEMTCNAMDLRGKKVAVVDDIIETGGTLVRFYDFIKKCGAEKSVVLATHGVLKSGIERIKKTYSGLYLTNAIDQKEANVDIKDLILKNIIG